ncbi:MAG: V-type ATPase 116kDa subunit family protein [Candidatus Wallbacteria bacterium]|nr:V-type ATPase 116kDa subunit family protein [Candidatus Wallbacteria bacterium]
MSKIEIFGLYEETDRLLRFLQKSGDIHLVETATPTDSRGQFRRLHAPSGRTQDEPVTRIVTEVEEIYRIAAAGLPPAPGESVVENATDHTACLREISRIRKKIFSLVKRKKNLSSDLSDLLAVRPERIALAQILSKVMSGGVKDPPACLVLIPEKRNEHGELLATLAAEHFGKGYFNVLSELIDGKKTILTAVYGDNSRARSFKHLLWEEGFEELNFPNRCGEGTLDDTLREFDDLLKELPDRLRKADEEIAIVLETHREFLAASMYGGRAFLERETAKGLMAATKYAVIINGWIPENRLRGFSERLDREFGDSAIVRELDIIHDEVDSIPTLLRNTVFSKSFEQLLRILPPVSYTGVDPTFLNAFTFPLFFGFMLGDVVYGLLVVLLALYLRKALSPQFSFVSSIAMCCGFSSIFFGVLFWEFLGNLGEGHAPFSFLPILNRHLHIKEFLVTAILIGAVHVSLGFLMAALKAYTHRFYRKLIGESSLISLIWMVFLLIGSTERFGILPAWLFDAALAGIFINIITVFLTLGAFSVLEIFSIVANILSYSRLMAIGFSSVILAFIANSLSQTAGSMVSGFLIGFSLHLVNLALGIFGPVIHSLRLHYVEFLPKFYETTGRDFQPFGCYANELAGNVRQ